MAVVERSIQTSAWKPTSPCRDVLCRFSKTGMLKRFVGVTWSPCITSWNGRVVKASDLNYSISLGVSPRRFKSCFQRSIGYSLIFGSSQLGASTLQLEFTFAAIVFAPCF